MLLTLITFGFFYCFIEEFIKIKFNNIPLLFYNSFMNLLSEKCWGHMWYIYMIIGIYIITPIIKAYINNTNDMYQKYIMAILFLLSIIMPTINNIFNLSLTTFRLGSLNYVCIYMLGYYISNDSNKNNNKIYYILGFLGAIIFTIFARVFYDKGILQNNVFIIFVAALIFRLFSTNYINIKLSVLNLISKYSFGIYLLHPFFLNIFMKEFGIYPDVMPTFIGEFVFFIVTVVISLISSFILSKLPIFKKILI